MVETGSPQFVAARSVVSMASSAIWFPTVITMVNLTFWFPTTAIKDFDGQVSDSAYGSSVIMTIIFQLAGVCVGTLSAAVKWFVFVHAMCSETTDRSFKKTSKIEAFWTQRLVDWRGSLPSLHIRHYWCGTCIHAAKYRILNFCIRVQFLIVLSSKVIVFISVEFLSILLWCLKCIKKSKIQQPSDFTASNDYVESESGHRTEQDLSRFVLLLEGEAKLPKATLKLIFNQADNIFKPVQGRNLKI